jgi:hypothetical protein
MTTVEKLKGILEGIAIDIFVAEQAYLLIKAIGQNKDKIERFNEFFGTVHFHLVDSYILHIARIYEHPNNRNFNKSIPTVIDLFKNHSKDLNIVERYNLDKSLSLLNDFDKCNLKLPDEGLTNAILCYFSKSIDDHKDKIKVIKKHRDKRITHNEMINIASLPTITWAESNHLIEIAKTFVGVIGIGYLSNFNLINGEYILTADAERIIAEFDELVVKLT